METSTFKDFTLSTVPVYLFYHIIFQIGIPSQYIKYFGNSKGSRKRIHKLMKQENFAPC